MSDSPTTAATIIQSPIEVVPHIDGYGGVTGAILAAVVGFTYIYSKFRKDVSTNKAEGNLYENLSKRIENISETLDKVEGEREELRQKVAACTARIFELEQHEVENAVLRQRLHDKEQDIVVLQHTIEIKQDEIAELRERICTLEQKMCATELRQNDTLETFLNLPDASQ